MTPWQKLDAFAEGLISIFFGISGETLTHFCFSFFNSIGAARIIYFSYSEGKESFEKAADLEAGCAQDE